MTLLSKARPGAPPSLSLPVIAASSNFATRALFATAQPAAPLSSRCESLPCRGRASSSSVRRVVQSPKGRRRRARARDCSQGARRTCSRRVVRLSTVARPSAVARQGHVLLLTLSPARNAAHHDAAPRVSETTEKTPAVVAACERHRARPSTCGPRQSSGRRAALRPARPEPRVALPHGRRCRSRSRQNAPSPGSARGGGGVHFLPRRAAVRSPDTRKPRPQGRSRRRRGLCPRRPSRRRRPRAACS